MNLSDKIYSSILVGLGFGLIGTAVIITVSDDNKAKETCLPYRINKGVLSFGGKNYSVCEVNDHLEIKEWK